MSKRFAVTFSPRITDIRYIQLFRKGSPVGFSSPHDVNTQNMSKLLEPCPCGCETSERREAKVGIHSVGIHFPEWCEERTSFFQALQMHFHMSEGQRSGSQPRRRLMLPRHQTIIRDGPAIRQIGQVPCAVISSALCGNGQPAFIQISQPNTLLGFPHQ